MEATEHRRQDLPLSSSGLMAMSRQAFWMFLEVLSAKFQVRHDKDLSHGPEEDRWDQLASRTAAVHNHCGARVARVVLMTWIPLSQRPKKEYLNLRTNKWHANLVIG